MTSLTLGKANSGASLGSRKIQLALLWAFFPLELYKTFSGQESVCAFSFASLNAILGTDHWFELSESHEIAL